jgi:arylsulfatase A-like enzyme
VVESPVSGVDLPPTFFSFAGIELPWEMHGHDLSPLVGEESKQWNHPAMLVHTAKFYGSETTEIPGSDDPDLYHGPGVPWYVLLSKGHYKYVRNLVEDEVEELYDLQNDPNELVNLALMAEHLDRLREFRAATIKELKRTDAPFVNSMPAFGTPK